MIEDGVPLDELKTKYSSYIALIEQAEIDAQNRANDAASAAGLDPTEADPTTGGGESSGGEPAAAATRRPRSSPPTDTDPI